MNIGIYKERNKRILKMLAVLFVVLSVCAVSFYISFYGSELHKGMVSAIVGVLNCLVAVNAFHKAKLEKIAATYKAAAIVFFAGGLVWIYLGILRALRFYN